MPLGKRLKSKPFKPFKASGESSLRAESSGPTLEERLKRINEELTTALIREKGLGATIEEPSKVEPVEPQKTVTTTKELTAATEDEWEAFLERSDRNRQAREQLAAEKAKVEAAAKSGELSDEQLNAANREYLSILKSLDAEDASIETAREGVTKRRKAAMLAEEATRDDPQGAMAAIKETAGTFFTKENALRALKDTAENPITGTMMLPFEVAAAGTGTLAALAEEAVAGVIPGKQETTLDRLLAKESKPGWDGFREAVRDLAGVTFEQYSGTAKGLGAGETAQFITGLAGSLLTDPTAYLGTGSLASLPAATARGVGNVARTGEAALRVAGATAKGFGKGSRLLRMEGAATKLDDAAKGLGNVADKAKPEAFLAATSRASDFLTPKRRLASGALVPSRAMTDVGFAREQAMVAEQALDQTARVNAAAAIDKNLDDIARNGPVARGTTGPVTVMKELNVQPAELAAARKGLKAWADDADGALTIEEHLLKEGVSAPVIGRIAASTIDGTQLANGELRLLAATDPAAYMAAIQATTTRLNKAERATALNNATQAILEVAHDNKWAAPYLAATKADRIVAGQTVLPNVVWQRALLPLMKSTEKVPGIEAMGRWLRTSFVSDAARDPTTLAWHAAQTMARQSWNFQLRSYAARSTERIAEIMTERRVERQGTQFVVSDVKTGRQLREFATRERAVAYASENLGVAADRQDTVYRIGRMMIEKPAEVHALGQVLKATPQEMKLAGEVATQLAQDWDYILNFTQGMGVNIAEFADDVIEGYYARQFSKELKGMALRNPELRRSIRDAEAWRYAKLTNQQVPKGNQFAKRSARDITAEALEVELRKNYGIGPEVPVFETNPQVLMEEGFGRAARAIDAQRRLRTGVETFGKAPQQPMLNSARVAVSDKLTEMRTNASERVAKAQGALDATADAAKRQTEAGVEFELRVGQARQTARDKQKYWRDAAKDARERYRKDATEANRAAVREARDKQKYWDKAAVEMDRQVAAETSRAKRYSARFERLQVRAKDRALKAQRRRDVFVAKERASTGAAKARWKVKADQARLDFDRETARIEVIETARNLPPPKEGYTRIYRGEEIAGPRAELLSKQVAVTGVPKGHWATDEIEYATAYSVHHGGKEGHILYRDVPTAEADAARLANRPPEIRKLATPAKDGGDNPILMEIEMHFDDPAVGQWKELRRTQTYSTLRAELNELKERLVQAQGKADADEIADLSERIGNIQDDIAAIATSRKQAAENVGAQAAKHKLRAEHDAGEAMRDIERVAGEEAAGAEKLAGKRGIEAEKQAGRETAQAGKAMAAEKVKAERQAGKAAATAQGATHGLAEGGDLRKAVRKAKRDKATAQADFDTAADAYKARVDPDTLTAKSRAQVVLDTLKASGHALPEGTSALELLLVANAAPPLDWGELARLATTKLDAVDRDFLYQTTHLLADKSAWSSGMQKLAQAWQEYLTAARKSVLARIPSLGKDFNANAGYALTAGTDIKYFREGLAIAQDVASNEHQKLLAMGVITDMTAADIRLGAKVPESVTRPSVFGRLGESVRERGILGTAVSGAVKVAKAPARIFGKKAAAKVDDAARVSGEAVGKATDAALEVRHVQDNAFRISHFKTMKAKGMSDEAAAFMVKRDWGNFSEYTKFEVNVLRNIFFFYAWKARAIKATAMSFMYRPLMARAMMALVAGNASGDEDAANFLRGSGGFYLGQDENGFERSLFTGHAGYYQPLHGLGETELADYMMKKGEWAAKDRDLWQLPGVIGRDIIRGAPPIVRGGFEITADRDLFSHSNLTYDAGDPDERQSNHAPAAMQWLPAPLQEFFGFEAVPGDDGAIQRYVMDPGWRILFGGALPGVAATAGDIGRFLKPGSDFESAIRQTLGITTERVQKTSEYGVAKRRLYKAIAATGLAINDMHGKPLRFSEVAGLPTASLNDKSIEGQRLIGLRDARKAKLIADGMKKDEAEGEATRDILHQYSPAVLATMDLVTRQATVLGILRELEKPQGKTLPREKGPTKRSEEAGKKMADGLLPKTRMERRIKADADKQRRVTELESLNERLRAAMPSKRE